MKLYQTLHGWILNILLFLVGIGLLGLYVMGVVLAFIAVAQ